MPEDSSRRSLKHKPPKIAKTKTAKTPKVKGVPNKHLHARTTFLYQAATYLTLQAATEIQEHGNEEFGKRLGACPQSALALQLGTHLRAVSLKGQVRLSTDLKRTVCKTCNAILIPGKTSTQAVENTSKGGRKPHADVLVIECNFCTSKKRFPIGTTRQQKKTQRVLNTREASPNEVSLEAEQSATPAIQTGTDQSVSSS